MQNILLSTNHKILLYFKHYIGYILNPELAYIKDKIQVKFNGNCLKQEKTTRKILNLCIVYEIKLRPFSQTNDFAIANCLVLLS